MYFFFKSTRVLESTVLKYLLNTVNSGLSAGVLKRAKFSMRYLNCGNAGKVLCRGCTSKYSSTYVGSVNTVKRIYFEVPRYFKVQLYLRKGQYYFFGISNIL